MNPTLQSNFKNEPTRRFYQFFQNKIKTGQVTHSQLAESFGIYQTNPPSFMSNLKAGRIGISIEMIEIAEKFGLDPLYLFTGKLPGSSENATAVQEDQYGIERGPVPATDILNNINESSGNHLHELLKKHKVNIEDYAADNLSISRQQLYAMMKGNSRLYFDVVVKICKDMGETLDQFFPGPLPKGHLLEKIKLQEKHNEALQKQIDFLESQLKLKNS